VVQNDISLVAPFRDVTWSISEKCSVIHGRLFFGLSILSTLSANILF